jgi:hypothetical protein
MFIIASAGLKTFKKGLKLYKIESKVFEDLLQKENRNNSAREFLIDRTRSAASKVDSNRNDNSRPSDSLNTNNNSSDNEYYNGHLERGTGSGVGNEKASKFHNALKNSRWQTISADSGGDSNSTLVKQGNCDRHIYGFGALSCLALPLYVVHVYV